LIQGVETFHEQRTWTQKISVSGAMTKKDAPLDLLPNAVPGKWILLCHGIAITNSKTEENCVSGHSR
jgi:hydrogenase maturation factor